MYRKQEESAPQSAPPVYYAAQPPYPPPQQGVVYVIPQGGQQPYYGPVPQNGQQPYYGPYPSPYQSLDAELGAQPPSDDRFGSSFDDEMVRRAFVRKVFTLLAIQLMITAGIVAMFMFIEPLRKFTRENTWMIFIGLVIMIVCICILGCCGEVRKQFPWNYILLTLFTLAASLTLGPVCAVYSVQVVTMALLVTAMICLTISIIACFCPVDITGCGCMLFIALMAFMLFSLIAVIVQLFLGRMKILELIIGGIGTVLFSLYLMYDIQMIMGGKKVEISPEEHVFAVIQLYMDVLLIFQYVLMLIGASQD